MILDIETEGLPFPGTANNRIVCIQWGTEGDEHLAAPAVAPLDELVEAATRPDGVLVAHHATFDFGALCAWRPSLTARLLAARICDSEICAKLALIEVGALKDKGKPVPTSLLACLDRWDLVTADELEELRREKTDPEAWRVNYGRLLGVPVEQWPERARAYALRDVTYTDRLYQRLREYTERAIPLTRAALALQLTHYRGIRLDTALVKRIGDEARASSEVASALLVASGLAELDRDGVMHRKVAKIRAAVKRGFAAKGRVPPTTEKGEIRTDADTLARCGNPVLVEWAGAVGAHKLLTGYCDPWAGVSRVHPTYWLPLATCRTSASGPNIQNPPSRRKSRFRDVFRPEPGNVWIDIDLSQAELVATGQLCLWWGCGEELATAVRDRVDIHWTIARERLHLGPVARDKDRADWELARQRAKEVTFGRLGLLGARALKGRVDAATGGDVPMQECRDAIDAYERLYPCVRAYLDRQQWEHACGRPAEIIGAGGPKGSDIIRRLCAYPTEQCNTPFQGLVARAALAAVVALTQASLGRSWWLSAFIHDEFLIQAPESQAEAVREEADEIIRSTVQRYMPDVPVRTEGHIGPYWDH